MAWDFIRLILFAAAFFIGMNLTHHRDTPRPSSTVVIIVPPVPQSKQSKMVAVRDHTAEPEKIPHLNRIPAQLQ